MNLHVEEANWENETDKHMKETKKPSLLKQLMKLAVPGCRMQPRPSHRWLRHPTVFPASVLSALQMSVLNDTQMTDPPCRDTKHAGKNPLRVRLCLEMMSPDSRTNGKFMNFCYFKLVLQLKVRCNELLPCIFTKCHHWEKLVKKYTGFLCVIPHNCTWIYNHLKNLFKV